MLSLNSRKRRQTKQQQQQKDGSGSTKRKSAKKCHSITIQKYVYIAIELYCMYSILVYVCHYTHSKLTLTKNVS